MSIRSSKQSRKPKKTNGQNSTLAYDRDVRYRLTYLFMYLFIYVFIYFMMNGLFFDVRHKSNDAFSRKLSIT